MSGPQPHEQEMLALLLNAIAQYARPQSGTSETGKRLQKLLKNSPASRAAAAKVVASVQSMPEARRRAVLGPYANVMATPLPPAVERKLGEDLARRARAQKTPGLRAAAHPAGRGTSATDRAAAARSAGVAPSTYFLEYAGIHCVKETSWDRGSNSDEIYVVTTVVSIDAMDPNAELEVRGEKHPVSQSYYSGVDKGESRDGPVAICWKGPASNLSLITTVFEHDDGDPNAHKDTIMFIVTVAAFIVASVFLTAFTFVVGMISPAIGWTINKALGSADDLISTEYLTVDASQLGEYAATAPLQNSKMQRIRHHFYTTHKGHGAEYRVLFAARAVPVPAPAPRTRIVAVAK
jgi:hypothetical protein